MTIKKVKPKELPKDIIFRMNYLFKTTLDDFIIMVNNKKEIVYINASVPQSDVDDFMKYITYEGEYVNDYKAGLGKMIDRLYEKYGENVYSVLADAYDYQKNRREEQQAKEAAKVILPLIRKEVKKKRPAVRYGERLLHEIWSAGYDLKEKTPENLTNFGTVYVFYLGYLMGAGKLDSGTDVKTKYIMETERIMRQIKDVEALKKIYTVAKTLLDIRREKGGAA
ncbi:MAG: hypothetical protein K2O15_07965 [Lachnospiraceae bacterium]|nr:hypothetical protein [Lachnospiraceae bacterium]